MDRRISPSVWTAIVATMLFVAVLSPQAARADGCYFPEKAFQKMPAIPVQRAIVVHKDQTERLVIESTLSAEGQRFGWIVPVPGKPTDITEASPGLLNTLSVFTAAKITHDMGDILPLLLVLPVGVTLWIAYMLVEQPAAKTGFRRILDLLAAIALLVFFVSIFLPHLGKAGSSGATTAGTGVRVESSQIVGNYEVTLLQADSAEAFTRWLDENGFAALPLQGHAIVEDYIRQNWYFVAAKLQRDGTGPARPHPLSITFSSANAIYPMRLTALAGSPVALELFVVSDQQASAGGLRREFCDVLKTHESDPARYRSQETGAVTGHPQSQGILWDGCCLTRLAGVVQPGDMEDDIGFQWGPPSPYRRHLYSQRGAWTIALLVAAYVWTIGAPFALLAAKRRAPERYIPRIGFSLRRAIGPALATSLVLGLGTYLVLPKTEINALRGSRQQLIFGSYLHRVTSKHPTKALDVKTASSLAEFRRIFAQDMDELLRDYELVNHVTGERIREEDSPGNYTIREEADKFVVTWYDSDMEANESVFPKPSNSGAAVR